MYLTSHRVRARSGREAVHSFLHEHGDVPWPDDVSSWPEERPGRLHAHRSALEVGGNTVRAYLDVLAPDATPVQVVEDALEHFSNDVNERRNPTLFRSGQVTLRFGVELKLEPTRGEVLLELVTHLVRLLKAEWPFPPATAPNV